MVGALVREVTANDMRVSDATRQHTGRKAQETLDHLNGWLKPPAGKAVTPVTPVSLRSGKRSMLDECEARFQAPQGGASNRATRASAVSRPWACATCPTSFEEATSRATILITHYWDRHILLYRHSAISWS